MAQKRIDFYGQFRPTGVDETAGLRARELAGLIETGAGIAAGFAVGKAKEQAAKEGAAIDVSR